MKNSLCIILILCISSTYFIGCKTGKHISAQETIALNNEHNYLILHDRSNKYKLYQYEFTESKLKGKLYAYSKENGPQIHVYTSISDELINNGNLPKDFEINESDINKITLSKVNMPLTTLTAVGGIIIFRLLLLLLSDSFYVGSSF